MRIAVIGGAGKMGRWFVNHFQQLNHTIIVADPQKIEEQDLETTKSNTSAVGDADLVLISVPMEATADVIREVIPHMKPNSILCEISTVKSNVIGVLGDVSAEQIRPISIHPLFGPGATSLKKKFALIPIRNRTDERKVVDTLFPDSEIIIVDIEDHERIMALTLSLPYFTNMILASIFKDQDIQLMEQLSGTTFAVQFMLTGSIMVHPSEFHVALHIENKYALEILSKFQRAVNRELGILTKDKDGFEQSYRNHQAVFGSKISLESKYAEMYRVLSIMEKNREGGS